MRPLVALVVFAALAPAAPVPKAIKKQNDADSLVGTWKPAEGRTEWFEFTADGKMKAWSTGTAQHAVPYKWTLDDTASPRRMTWTGSAQWECVYELNGDTLRISYVTAGQKIPTEVGPTKTGFYCDLRRDTSAK